MRLSIPNPMSLVDWLRQKITKAPKPAPRPKRKSPTWQRCIDRGSRHKFRYANRYFTFHPDGSCASVRVAVSDYGIRWYWKETGDRVSRADEDFLAANHRASEVTGFAPPGDLA